MPALAILSIAFTVVMLVLSIIFKVAGKLRLTLPVLFFLLMAFPFNRWASANETLVWAILGGLIALCLLSWIISLVKTIKRRCFEKDSAEARLDYMQWQREKAHALGYSDMDVYYDEDGNIRNERTKERIEI